MYLGCVITALIGHPLNCMINGAIDVSFCYDVDTQSNFAKPLVTDKFLI